MTEELRIVERMKIIVTFFFIHIGLVVFSNGGNSLKVFICGLMRIKKYFFFGIYPIVPL